jgi:CRISPR system Cascade subunit CasE
MYATTLTLNSESRQVCACLQNRYEFHRTLVTRFFSEAQGKILYRVDESQTPGLPHRMMILSVEKPNLHWATKESAGLSFCYGQVEVKLYDLSWMTAGRWFQFSLMAEPTRKNQAGQRMPLSTDSECLAWLAGKGKRFGFRLSDARILGKLEWVIVKNRSGSDGPNQYRVGPVHFVGLLQVVDAQKFIEGVTGGIGHGKYLGLGLLALAVPIGY